MRIFTLIALALFITIFSDANAQTSTGGYKISYSSEISHGYIDKLNDIAENIYLTSPDSAHKVAENALLLSNKANYALGKGRSFLNLGTVYWAQSYFPISLFYLKSAISNLPKNQHRYLSIAYKSLGRSFADLKDYNLAFKNLDTALQYAGNDKGCAADVYGERAYVYFRLNNFKKALELAKYSLKLNKLNHDEQRTADLYGHLGNIYLHNLNYNAALAYNDSAFSMGVRLHNKRLLAYTYTSYAVAYNGLGNFNKAVNCAEKGISLASSIGILDAETKAFDALINTYILQHDYVKALEYQKRFNIIKDSLTNIAKLKTITLVQNYYSLNEKINGLTVMAVNEKINKAKIKSQHIVIQVLCISILFLAAILTATYYFYKQKKILSNKLQSQHQELLGQKQFIELQSANLQKANDLKDKLFAVIGHDLRSPVANLSSIIEMFDEGYLTATEVNSLMKNINPIVKGAALTLSNLIEWAGSQIKGRSLELCSVDIFLMGVEMEQTFMHSLKMKGIEFINQAYPGKAAIADENHLKVILRNLISNAIKFTGNRGSIALSTVIEQNEVIVSVKDNGKGMSADEINKLFYLGSHFSNSGTSGEKGTGIGLILCKELVELNGGKLKVKSKPGKGSTFYFNLPLVKTYA